MASVKEKSVKKTASKTAKPTAAKKTVAKAIAAEEKAYASADVCLLYTSDAADE